MKENKFIIFIKKHFWIIAYLFLLTMSILWTTYNLIIYDRIQKIEDRLNNENVPAERISRSSRVVDNVSNNVETTWACSIYSRYTSQTNANLGDLNAFQFGLDPYIEYDNITDFYLYPSNAFVYSLNGEERLYIYSYHFKYDIHYNFYSLGFYFNEIDENNQENEYIVAIRPQLSQAYLSVYTNYVINGVNYLFDEWYDDLTRSHYSQSLDGLFETLTGLRANGVNSRKYDGLMFVADNKTFSLGYLLSMETFYDYYYIVDYRTTDFLFVNFNIRFCYLGETYSSLQLVYANASSLVSSLAFGNYEVEYEGNLINPGTYLYLEDIDYYFLYQINATRVISNESVCLGITDLQMRQSGITNPDFYNACMVGDIHFLHHIMPIDMFNSLNTFERSQLVGDNVYHNFRIKILSGLDTKVQSEALVDLYINGYSSREALPLVGVLSSSSSVVEGGVYNPINNVFTLILSAFYVVLPLLYTEIAPNITIGLIMFIPLVLTIIIVVLKLVKK